MEIIQVVRDIAIIVLAIESIVLLLGLILLAWQAWKLVGLARKHVDRTMGTASEVLGVAKETASTVSEIARQTRGTASFVNDRTAKPVIELYRAVSGASRFAQAVFRRGRGKQPQQDGEE
jgi:hypothetical protein